jgi:hypothetical protein
MDGRGERKMESGRWREYMYGYDEKGAGKAPPSKRGGGGGKKNQKKKKNKE